MLEGWILEKIDGLRPAPLIILRDPQRVIQPGDYVVDGWAEQHDYSVFFCAGNLALREMVEAVRDDPETRVLVVDRSRERARNPLFYPDLDARAGARCQLHLSLHDFLVQHTGDARWPHLVDDRNLSRLVLANLPGTLEAHRQLRQASPTRFSDTDLYKIVLGATLEVNPFRTLSPSDVRRLCIEQHHALEELDRVLPDAVMEALRRAIADAPRPFCWLLERDPALVIRAFTLAALMHQHGLEYGVLLPNLDPALHDLREIDPRFLDQAMQDQLVADPDRVVADVRDAERFLAEDPARLAFLLRDRLGLDDPARALEALRRERLSPLVRSLALASLLADLILERDVKFHGQVVALLDEQSAQTDIPALSRPTEQWQALESAYRRALEVLQLWIRLARHAKRFAVTAPEDLDLTTFDRLWNGERLNRLDYYTSDLERRLRVGDVLPVAHRALWPELQARWEKARAELAATIRSIGEVQNLVDARFQDLYRLHYTRWIQRSDAPVVFTHQFLPRLLQAHWDPQSGRKAVVMVFDGLRTDAWDELLRPVLEERFELIERRPGSALIPTETHLSRKAISAGCLPDAFCAKSELDLLRAWLRQHMGLNPHFEVVRDDDTVASGMTVRYVSDSLEYIVFNFTDRNLHGNPQDLAFIYDATVREIIRQDVRRVLRDLPDDALLFVTSDHGFVPVPRPTVTVPGDLVADRHDVRYRHALVQGHLEGKHSEHVVEFDARVLGIPAHSETVPGVPIRYVLFPRPGFTLRRQKGHRPPDRYTHGGLSLAECMVPMVVMGPRRADQPVLTIENVQQVGSVSAGEGLALEISVVASQLALPDLAITLAFSRDEIPTRREVFCGLRTTYTVRWQPRITAEDRQGEAVTLPVTAILTYRQEGRDVRVSHSTDVRVKLDPNRLHRRVDSKLDLLMGKVPKGLKS